MNLCPVCKSSSLEREMMVVTRGLGDPMTCKSCGFRFLAKDNRLVKPLPLVGHKYMCPGCRKDTPKEVVLPVLPPRLGLECSACKKILCYWEGEAPADLPMASEKCFRFSDFFEDFVPNPDPVKSALQVSLMETLFDALPVSLTDAVKLFERRLEQTGVIMPKKRRRLTKENEEKLEKQIKTEERKEKRKRKKAKSKPKPPPPPPVEPPEQLEHPAGFGGEPQKGQTLNPEVPPPAVAEEKTKKKGKKNAKRKKRKKQKKEEA